VIVGFQRYESAVSENGVVILNEFVKSVDMGKPLSNYGGKPHESDGMSAAPCEYVVRHIPEADDAAHHVGAGLGGATLGRLG